MIHEKDRILSYKLAAVLEPSEIEQVSGGSGTKTVGSQRIVSTNKHEDETIAFDNWDTM